MAVTYDNAEKELAQPQRVTVVDFDMPFLSMVLLMIKWAIAAVPAAIVLMCIGFFISMIFGGIIGQYSHPY